MMDVSAGLRCIFWRRNAAHGYSVGSPWQLSLESHTTELVFVFQKAMHGGGVDRLTDTSKYTGSHKERFDESGKGKGIAGREEVHDNDGYVGGYKGKDTYDKSH